MDKNKKKPVNKGESIDIDDEGVIYDLSTGKKLASPNKISKNKKKLFDINSNYAVFYMIAILVAIIAAVMLFIATVQHMTGDAIPTLPSVDPSPPIATIPEGLIPDIEREPESLLLGVIQHIDTLNRVFTIHDISNSGDRNTYILNVVGATDLRDRFGQGLVFAEFSLGDIVNVSFTPSNSTLTSLQISTDTWERRLVSGLQINQNSNLMTIDGSTFSYNEQLQILNNGTPYSIANLSPLNVLTMRGVNNTVWVIEVESGFGSISIINGSHIIDGTIEISRTTTTPIPIGTGSDSSVQEMDMPEGLHRIIIRGSNMSPYTREVIVNNAETTIVDLSTVPLTSGNLSITTNIPTATVSIDGEEVDFSEPINLNFGQFTITATAPGYQSFESVVTINSASHQLTINLVEEIINANVEIRSIPSGADVLIDNSFVGVTPITATVPRGHRSLTLRRDGYQTVTMTIEAGATSMPYLLELQPIIQPAPPIEPPPPPPAPPEPTEPDFSAPPPVPQVILPPPVPPVPPSLPIEVEPPTLPLQDSEDGAVFIPGPGQ